MLHELFKCGIQEYIFNFIICMTKHADPMTFPIVFPHRDLGWTYDMCQKNLRSMHLYNTFDTV